MKRLGIKILTWIILALGVSYSCTDLDIIPPCTIETHILPDTISICTVPCEKNFRLANVENLPQDARFLWTLARGAEEISLASPTAKEISVTLTEEGAYLLAVQLTFPFEGCDQTFSKNFAIGIDPPIPLIQASALRCTVGECDLTFTAANENTTDWSWRFPGDPNNYQNQQSVSYSFNEAPGSYEVILTACNLGGCIPDTVTITVNPQTFLLKTDAGQNLTKVYCAREQADGGFNVIGNNGEHTYSFPLSRKGELDANAVFVYPGPGGGDHRSPRVLNCRFIDGTYIALGAVTRHGADNSTNEEFYLATFNSNFVPGIEVAGHSTGNGDETGRGICGAINGGYVIVGDNQYDENPANPDMEGLFLERVNSSFEEVASRYPLADKWSVGHDILNLGDHYLVIGDALNMATSQIEGCYFELDQELNLQGGIEFLGLDFSPRRLVDLGQGDFAIVGQEGNTARVKFFGPSIPDYTKGNRRINYGALSPDGKLILVGYDGTSATKNPLLLVLNYPESNQVLIEKTFLEQSETGEFFHVDFTNDGGYILTGTAKAPGDQLLIARTDVDGQIGN